MSFIWHRDVGECPQMVLALEYGSAVVNIGGSKINDCSDSKHIYT